MKFHFESLLRHCRDDNTIKDKTFMAQFNFFLEEKNGKLDYKKHEFRTTVVRFTMFCFIVDSKSTFTKNALLKNCRSSYSLVSA